MSSTNTLWFESIPSLKRAMLLLEKVSPDYQNLIATQLSEFTKSYELSNAGFDDVKNIGYEKVQAMMAVRNSGRWFVNKGVIVRALNDIYMLQDAHRNQAGQRILLCIQAIDNYFKPEEKEKNSHEDRIAIHRLIKSVFEQDLDVFVEQGAKKKEEKQAKLAAAEEDFLQQLQADIFGDSPELGAEEADRLTHVEADKIKRPSRSGAGVKIYNEGSDFKIGRDT